MSKPKTTENEYTIAEAYRYLANAKETLCKSPIEYGRYIDKKYVSEASGIAYLAALRALDAYLLNKGIPEKKLPKSIEGYWVFIKQHIPLNGKLSASLRIVYEDLHLGAYYRGFTSVNVIKDGLLHVKKIIEMINNLMDKTPSPNFVSEPKTTYKRTKNKLQE
ncbi:MAG: DUF5618 family protein [Bacteroidota bacterium]